MAVYKRVYKGYQGPVTAEWSRFLVIPRHAWRTLLQYRLLTIFYVLCFFFPLGCAVAIYLNNNLGFLGQYMRVPQDGLFEVGDRFFLIYTNVQGALAFLLTAFVGPGLVSPDLVHGALPLYLCRPFSRAEYVLGKMAVLLGLLSNITWIPGLLLWSMQAGMADGWGRTHLPLAGGIVAVSLVWILVMSMMALALSAWVRWRIIAGALMLVVFFLAAGLAAAINEVLRTDLGHLIDPLINLERFAMAVFGVELPEGASVEQSLAVLAATTAVCLWLLAKKIKACEVVR